MSKPRFLYEALKEVLIDYQQGFRTFEDLMYVLLNEVEFGTLTREEVQELLRSPTLATLDVIFGKARAVEVEGIKIAELPAVIVVQRREDATYYVQRYPEVYLLEDRLFGLHVASITKLLSWLVTKRDVPKVVIIPDRELKKFREEDLAAITVACRLRGVRLLSTKEIKLATEESSFSRDSENFLIDVISRKYGDLYESIKATERIIVDPWKIKGSRYEAAIAELIDRWGKEKEARELGLNPNRLERSPFWYLYGSPTAKMINDEVYRKAVELGFDEKTARLIAQWRVQSILDIVELLKRLRPRYKDEQYFLNEVMKKIAEIFGYDPNILRQAWTLLK